jgi:tRNA dimethylallyltransferase
MNPCLVVIMGPTAVGKTSLSIALAQAFNSHIISTDSRQFYKEMEIGTAKPSKAELETVPHHFINNRSITDYYSAGDFEKEAKGVLHSLFKKGLNPIFATGGSGLYVKALCEGLDEVPKADLALRERLISNYEIHGLAWLHSTLKSVNPDAILQLDSQNPQRLMRAIELAYQGGIVKKEKPKPFYKVIKIGLMRDRAELYQRINQRVDLMIEAGLIDEVKLLVQHRNENALQTVGYSEIFEYLDGNLERSKAIDLIKQHSRNYAKKQLTWFRKDSEINWFSPNQTQDILYFIQNQLKLF